MPGDADKQLSKALSWLLRHGAPKQGFSVLPGGYLYVKDILKQKNFAKYSIEDIQQVVNFNDKQRFALRPCPQTGELQIKANQGHSYQVEDLELEEIHNSEEAPLVIHGTYGKNWSSIKEKGLSRMNRTHIHFTPGEPGQDGVISGMRSSCQLFIYIDIDKAIADGIKFFRSPNNVILSPGNSKGFIEPKYFKKVVQAHCIDCDALEMWAWHLLSRKHQRNVYRADVPPEIAERSIYVSGFPIGIKDMEVFNYFSKYGDIQNITPIRNAETGGFYFFEFTDRRISEEVIKMRHCYNGFPLKVSRRRVRQIEDAAQRNTIDESFVLRMVKKVMTPLEQMQTFVRNVELTDEDVGERNRFCWDLQKAFRTRYPKATVYPFGSTVNGLGFRGCDLDIYVDFGFPPPGAPMPIPTIDQLQMVHDMYYIPNQAEQVKIAFGIIRKIPGLVDVVPILKARIPILKFRCAKLAINCDLSFRNSISLRNSNLLRLLMGVDDRIRYFIIVLRWWAKRHDITGKRQGVQLNNFTWTWLIIFFLQQLPEPLLPTVEFLQTKYKEMGYPPTLIDGWDCSFPEEGDCIPPVKEDLAFEELLYDFFEFYANFDFSSQVICPLLGRSIPVGAFFNFPELPPGLERYTERYLSGEISPLPVEATMCVQDPFELNFNQARVFTHKGLSNLITKCQQYRDICAIFSSKEPGAKIPNKKLHNKVYPLLDMLFGSTVAAAVILKKGVPRRILEQDKTYHTTISIPMGKFCVAHPQENNPYRGLKKVKRIPTAETQEDLALRELEQKNQDYWCETVAKLVEEVFKRALLFDVMDVTEMAIPHRFEGGKRKVKEKGEEGKEPPVPGEDEPVEVENGTTSKPCESEEKENRNGVDVADVPQPPQLNGEKKKAKETEDDGKEPPVPGEEPVEVENGETSDPCESDEKENRDVNSDADNCYAVNYENLMKELKVDFDTKLIPKEAREGKADNVLKVFYCQAFYSTWERRKRFNTQFEFPEGMPFIDREERICSQMVHVTYKVKPELPRTCFICEVRRKENPTRIFLMFTDIASLKRTLKAVCNFLRKYLPNAIQETLKEIDTLPRLPPKTPDGPLVEMVDNRNAHHDDSDDSDRECYTPMEMSHDRSDEMEDEGRIPDLVTQENKGLAWHSDTLVEMYEAPSDSGESDDGEEPPPQPQAYQDDVGDQKSNVKVVAALFADDDEEYPDGKENYVPAPKRFCLEEQPKKILVGWYDEVEDDEKSDDDAGEQEAQESAFPLHSFLTTVTGEDEAQLKPLGPPEEEQRYIPFLGGILNPEESPDASSKIPFLFDDEDQSVDV